MSGNEGILRYAFERGEGVEGDGWWYPKFATETLDMDRPYEPDENINAIGDEGEGDSLKATGAGTITVVGPDTEGYLAMRAHHHGWYTQSSPAAGVHLYEMRREVVGTDDPVDHYIDSLNLGAWRDEDENPSEYQVNGAKVSVFRAAVSANKRLTYSHDLLFLRDRYMRKPSAVAVDAAYTGDVIVRGHRRAGDENGDHYKFKVPVGGGGALDGTADIEFGKGAAAYGATDVPVFANVWINVLNADGTRAGTREEPIQIMFLPNPGDVLTAGDEWFIYPTSPKPVSAQSTRTKLNGSKLDLEFSLGGSIITRTIEAWSLTMTEPREAKMGLGSNYAGRIGRPQNADRTFEVSFDSTYVDLKLKQALIGRRVISCYAKFWGTTIGATTHEDYSEFTLANMKLTGGAGATVSAPGELPEKPVMRAFAVPGTPTLVERHQCTVASIDPT